jgi:hypothetical protein
LRVEENTLQDQRRLVSAGTTACDTITKKTALWFSAMASAKNDRPSAVGIAPETSRFSAVGIAPETSPALCLGHRARNEPRSLPWASRLQRAGPLRWASRPNRARFFIVGAAPETSPVLYRAHRARNEPGSLPWASRPKRARFSAACINIAPHDTRPVE